MVRSRTARRPPLIMMKLYRQFILIDQSQTGVTALEYAGFFKQLWLWEKTGGDL